MNSVIIKVKITDEDPGSWYRGMIGKILEVYEDSTQLEYNDPMYKLSDDSGNKIFKRNCEIVPMIELYPTLSLEYVEK